MRPSTRVVQLSSLSATVALPPGVSVDALADTLVVKAEYGSSAVQLPGSEPADVSTAVASVPEPPSAEAITELVEASLGGPMLGTRLMSLLLQPLLWLVQVLPESLKPIGFGFLLLATVAATTVGAAIDLVLDPILGLFGLGVRVAAPVVAVEPDTHTSETVTSDREPAEPVAAEAQVATSHETAATSRETTAATAEPTEAMEVPASAAPDVAETQDLPEGPGTSTQQDLPADTVDPADDVSESVDPEVDSEDDPSVNDEVESVATQQTSEISTAREGSTVDDREVTTTRSGDDADS
ncbi:MAG: hypothetical protein U1C73_02205 [Dietzia sp.]|nr:hypothetical protein [Dietzia sp.]